MSSGPRGQDDLLAVGHGFGGVEDEVEQDLLDEVLGAGHRGKGGGAFEGDLHFAQEPVAQQLDGVVQDGIEVAQGRLVAGIAAEAEHGFDDAGALLDDGLDAVHAGADLLGIVEVVFDDLGGAFDDGEDVVEVMGDAGGERAQGVHLLAVQQRAVGELQLPRALGDLLLDFGVAAEQLAVAIEGQAGKEQRDGQPGKGNQDQARFLVPGQDDGEFQPGGVGVDVAVAVHGPDLEVMFAGRQVGEGDARCPPGTGTSRARPGGRRRAAAAGGCISICPAR